MGLRARIVGFIGSLVFDRPARKRTLSELADNLQNDGNKIQQKIAEKADSKAHRDKLIHIIGIERWGQRRLKVALGEPLVLDEHDGYCPPATSSWDELRADFHSMRAETVALGRELAKANLTPATTVRHNDFGDMSIHGWLRYLNIHANQESKAIK